MSEENKNDEKYEIPKIKKENKKEFEYKIILPEMLIKTEKFLNISDKSNIERMLDVKFIDEKKSDVFYSNSNGLVNGSFFRTITGRNKKKK